MPKKAKELSAIEVSRMTVEGRYPVGGVAGLCLKVPPLAPGHGCCVWLWQESAGTLGLEVIPT